MFFLSDYTLSDENQKTFRGSTGRVAPEITVQAAGAGVIHCAADLFSRMHNLFPWTLGTQTVTLRIGTSERVQVGRRHSAPAAAKLGNRNTNQESAHTGWKTKNAPVPFYCDTKCCVQEKGDISENCFNCRSSLCKCMWERAWHIHTYR